MEIDRQMIDNYITRDDRDYAHEDRMAEILDSVFNERMRQIEKWGDQHHDNGFWLAVLGEEFGEVARAMLKQKDGEQSLDIVEELTQVAAVAVAWIEDLTRE